MTQREKSLNRRNQRKRGKSMRGREGRHGERQMMMRGLGGCDFGPIILSRSLESRTVSYLFERRRSGETRKMEKYFGNAYRGDPGIPHADGDRFANIWIGSFAFSALTWFNPYMWHLTNQLNWHDKAMLYEQYHWKKAMKKKQPYKFKWNEYMSKDARDSYYFNWPVYFP